jgi:hypothetical protein
MKPKILFNEFRLPLFKAKVWVYITNNMRVALDEAEDKTSQIIAYEEEKKHIDSYTYAYEKDTGGKCYILFFKYNAKPGVIAHEIKHLVNILFAWHGYKLSLSNDEMECYYLQDIVNRIHNVIKKYNKNYKR